MAATPYSTLLSVLLSISLILCWVLIVVEASCSLPSLPLNTVRDSESNATGVQVNYSCIASIPDVYFNRQKDRTLSTYCDPGDSTWKPEPTPCYHLRCPLDEPVQYANKTTLDTWTNTTLTYFCRPGFTFDGFNNEWTLLCTDNGASPSTWEPVAPYTTGPPSICVASVCQPPDAYPAHASPPDLLESEMIIGSDVSYWCDVGYQFPPITPTAAPSREAHAHCQNTGFFNYDPPDCERVTCPTVILPNATISAVSFVAGDTGTWTCDTGMLFPGGGTVWTASCTEEGDWNPLPPSSGCRPPFCQEGWQSFNDSCYLVSDPTVELKGVAARNHCNKLVANVVAVENQEENDFLESITYALHSKSYWIGLYKNVNGDAWHWRNDQASSYRNWGVGYPQEDLVEQVESQLCVHLSAGGIWKDTRCDGPRPFVCKKLAICGPSPEIYNGDIVGSHVEYGELDQILTYQCIAGYFFLSDRTDTREVTCIAGGYWSVLESCQPRHCSYAQTVVNSLPSTTVNTAGSIIEYSCKPRFLFNDSSLAKSIECQNNGLWNAVLGNCSEIVCPVPGVQNADPRYGNSSTYEVDVYTCHAGYTFATGERNMSFACGVDGTWWPHNTHCERILCTTYTHEHATVSPQPAEYEEMVTVECEFGYQFPDTRTSLKMQCLDDGSYDTVVPECVALRCPGIPPNVTGAETDTDENLVGTQVNYTCTNGSVYLDGSRWRIGYCDPVTRLWTLIPTECVAEAVYIQTLFHHTPTEAANAIDLGTVAIVAMFTVLGAVVIFDFATCPLHFAKKTPLLNPSPTTTA